MLVMELMRGGDLHSALQRPDIRDALRWAARSGRGQGGCGWGMDGGHGQRGEWAGCTLLSFLREAKPALQCCAHLSTHPPILLLHRGRQVALDVAEALAFLHSCGVQHADLKPRWDMGRLCHVVPCTALPCISLAAWLHIGLFVQHSSFPLLPHTSPPPPAAT